MKLSRSPGGSEYWSWKTLGVLKNATVKGEIVRLDFEYTTEKMKCTDFRVEMTVGEIRKFLPREKEMSEPNEAMKDAYQQLVYAKQNEENVLQELERAKANTELAREYREKLQAHFNEVAFDFMQKQD